MNNWRRGKTEECGQIRAVENRIAWGGGTWQGRIPHNAKESALTAEGNDDTMTTSANPYQHERSHKQRQNHPLHVRRREIAGLPSVTRWPRLVEPKADGGVVRGLKA